MHLAVSDCLADFSAQDIASIRLVAMFGLLIGGITAGYLASSRFGLPKLWAKKIMTIVLVCFSWVIALFVIWQMQLTRELIWLPIVGLALMLIITVLSAGVFYPFKLQRTSRLTLILAGGLSNMGYTGGAFVCYALFGTTGLALANLYLVLLTPAIYLIFFPLLKTHELYQQNSNTKLKLTQVLDLRCLALPAVIIAIVLNLTDIKPPGFVVRFHIIDIFVYVASALAFFAIGIQVNLSVLKNYRNLYFPLALVKFIVTPAVAILLIYILAFSGQDLTAQLRKVIMVLSICPCAVIMVTMSNVFGLDGPLASALWVVTTVIFIAVIVPVLFLIFT